MSSTSQHLLRRLPQIEKALQWAAVEPLITTHSRSEVVRAFRARLAELRAAILGGAVSDDDADRLISEESIVSQVRDTLEERRRSAYRRVINATGILLHTGLGRAVLAREACEAFQRNLAGYSLVEVDPRTGERNQREAALRQLLHELTGAPAATVVNNNAAATLLILACFARGKEVIISRGQLIEIGGSYRIPDILRESGARLVEVGTTNRTYIEDYREAVAPETGLLLQVHTSNYEIRGFARHTPLEELVALGREHGIPVLSDLGSGCFYDLSPFGLRREPLVRDSVDAGADLICFSGDKLLGGPQAGIIVGNEKAVQRCRSHSLFRTVRVDKVTLILLENTLSLYRDPQRAFASVPILRMLSTPAEDVRRRAQAFLERWSENSSLEMVLVKTTAETGSGSLPAQEIPSWALALSDKHRGAEELASTLRQETPPVFSRIHEGNVLLDFRTVLPEDEEELRALLSAVAVSA